MARWALWRGTPSHAVVVVVLTVVLQRTVPAEMSRLPPLLPTPPSSHKLRGPDAVESGTPKWCPVEPPRPTSGSRSRYVSLSSASSRRRERGPSPLSSRRRERSPSPSSSRRRERSPSPSSSRHREGRPSPSSSRRREGRPPESSRNRSEQSPPPYKVRRRARSPPHRSITKRLPELQHSKWPRRCEAVVDDREKGEIAGSSRRDESAKRPSHSHYHCKHPEASLAAVEERLDPAIRSGVQKLDNEKMEGYGHNDHKALSRSSRHKKIRRKNRAEAKNGMRELKLQVPDAIEPCSRKLCSVELPIPAAASQRRHKSLYSSHRTQEEHLLWSSMSQLGRPPLIGQSQSEPPPSAVHLHQKRIPSSISLQHCKRLHRAVALDRLRRGEVDAAEKRPGHSDYNCQHPETSSATVERLDPAIRGDRQKLDDEKIKMERKNQSDCKIPSRSARRKKTKRQLRSIAKKELSEMKKEKLLQKVKKLQACVWLLEKEGADRPEIMEIRSLLESAERQYAEKILEVQSAKEGPSASHEGLNKNKHEEMVGDEIIVNLLKAVSKQNELAEEVNHLKSELQVVRQDRDHQLAQVQSLMADIGKQKDMTRRCGVELENAMSRVSALEEECSLQRETIRTLQIQLSSANEKLKVSSSSTEDRC